MITKLEDYIKKVLPRISLIIVCLAPVIDWIINFFQSKNRVLSNPYSSTDFNLILLIALLNLIHDKLNAKEENRGDESNILLNRNQSDYYEIWEVCKKNREVTIEAYGHTFKTLWYNFIKKFLMLNFLFPFLSVLSVFSGFSFFFFPFFFFSFFTTGLSFSTVLFDDIS